MSKLRMVCPFSKGLCRECAIFRGRHLGLCSAETGNGKDWGKRMMQACKLDKGGDYEAWKELKTPSIPKSPKWLADIEDLIERREA
jgi:hypothetical protein